MFKKYKKGFTLVEILVAVALLSILAVIIILNLSNNLKQSDDKLYNEFIDKVKSAANVYIAANKEAEHYVETNEFYIITVEDLETAGLLDLESTINPKTNKSIKSLDKNDEYKYVKIYKDEKTNIGNSNATLIEYPVKGTNNFHYIITYKLGEFGHGCDTQTVPLNNNIVKLCIPSDDNADFLGWYLDEKLEKEFTSTNNNEKLYEINTNLTLYAKWKEIPKAPKIEYLNIISIDADFNVSNVNIEFKITDESGTDVEYCLIREKDNKDPNLNTCDWNVFADVAKPKYVIKNGIYKANSVGTSLSTGSGNSITYYLFAKNSASSEIASKQTVYTVYKTCSQTLQTLSACKTTCSAKCWKPGEPAPTCTKTAQYLDKYLKQRQNQQKECDSKSIDSTCNTEIKCCDKITKKTDYSACTDPAGNVLACGASGTKIETTRYYSYWYDASSGDQSIECQPKEEKTISCTAPKCCNGYCIECKQLGGIWYHRKYDGCGTLIGAATGCPGQGCNGVGQYKCDGQDSLRSDNGAGNFLCDPYCYNYMTGEYYCPHL